MHAHHLGVAAHHAGAACRQARNRHRAALVKDDEAVDGRGDWVLFEESFPDAILRIGFDPPGPDGMEAREELLRGMMNWAVSNEANLVKNLGCYILGGKGPGRNDPVFC